MSTDFDSHLRRMINSPRVIATELKNSGGFWDIRGIEAYRVLLPIGVVTFFVPRLIPNCVGRSSGHLAANSS